MLAPLWGWRRHEGVGSGRLVSNENPVPKGVETNGVSENRRRIWRTVDDVVDRSSTSGIQTESIANSLGDLVIGASGRGWREAPGEGRKATQILRPSPCPLPVGEGSC